ncbi:unnamed protein product [Hyaloperonospora brassicae]|uniref:Uncharacterized protein n=1 Tax=Hyaloperonospora brassicae TaxID=162125 RepID=A0AAV0V063_HYABA|nr:unnamed protein product [Hyaloperonospora brassicae]
MSHAKTASLPAAAAPVALPGSERADYRGKCRYKTGKCVQERALKTSGVAHNLCDEHRNRQNQHQRKLDAKNRQHKREQRVAANEALIARFAPYRPATKTAKGRESLTPSIDTSDDGESGDNAAQVAAAAAAAAATAGPAAGSGRSATSLLSAAPTSTVLAAAAASSVMFLPNGPQPPQMTSPFAMQNFDGIVVPLPSYLEGQERTEFRSRIYQKVLDFISEECISRFGAKAESTAVHGDGAGQPQAKCEAYAPATCNKVGTVDTADVSRSLSSGTEKVGTASATKRKH